MNYIPIIGLEIHVQLKTKSKMFCACDNSGEDKSPNTTICPVCMGHPGVLPVPNKRAIEYAVLAALSLNCGILDFSKFDRKNYFYPDLPKGYQISQFDKPIGRQGYLEISPTPSLPLEKGEGKGGSSSALISALNQRQSASTKIRLARVHLEEDAAKLLHMASTYIDFNRSGTPLLEIVTEPDIRSPQEAKIFLQELRLIMRYLGITSADMEKGHLRVDANISLSPLGPISPIGPIGPINPKTEIKNLNSFKAVERALEYEIIRQTKLFEKGKPPKYQSTRGWNETKGITEEQRIKEESHDYRYFPEPDTPPLNLIEFREMLKNKIPELPAAKRQRFQDEYGFNASDAKILTDDLHLANYTEKVISELYEWVKSQPEHEEEI